MRKKFLVESEAMCTRAKQFGPLRIDFFFRIKQYGHFGAKMAQVHRIYSVETAHGT